ncbi:MAG: SGNH/GDSL hydrolase family protein [Flavobacteriaceae bacterium]|nr:SGNH/GDSL hydrolase family protein [Flavobacteriaceae bacterium]
MSYSTIFGLLVAEGVLRYGIKTESSYSELNDRGFYVSAYQYDQDNIYHLQVPNYEINTKWPEYKHYRVTNNIGLVEQKINFSEINRDSVTVILCFGDSFTEGYGTTYDSTWVKVLEHTLKKTYKKEILAINAGIAGSDPFFYYKFFEDFHSIIKPNLTIFTLNYSDIYEVSMRGGQERFTPNGLKYKSNIKWESIYANCHLFRLLLHSVKDNNKSILPLNMNSQMIDDASNSVFKLIDEKSSFFDKFCYQWLIVVNPLLSECTDKQYHTEIWYKMKKVYPNNTLLLLDNWNTNLIDCNNIYWPIDQHHNTRGYQLIGKSIEKKIFESKLLDNAIY